VTTAPNKTAAAAQGLTTNAAHPSLRELDRPVKLTGANAPGWGSDVVAETLRALEIPYIALNPGASYRGLHDSIVNFLGNETPQMLLCLHEEVAVSIAHGYSKVTGKAMAAAVHSNVGLFHATMAIFNAWCDRMPVLILGATGPVDAAKRRPWIDWIHTAADQGALIRNYTKWDDQPASPAAAREAILRANWISNTAPMGPVYVNLDAEMQENKLTEPLPPIDVRRFQPLTVTAADPELVREAAKLLKSAKSPVILMGRVSRSLEGWNERVALAEALNAKVITELKLGAAFPTDHPLHAGAPGGTALGPDAQEAVRNATTHASPRRIRMSVHSAGEEATLSVHDDGVGFDLADAHARRAGMGLTSMRERVDLLDGHLDIHTAKGSGTTISATVPLDAAVRPLSF